VKGYELIVDLVLHQLLLVLLCLPPEKTCALITIDTNITPSDLNSPITEENKNAARVQVVNSLQDATQDGGLINIVL